VGKQVISGQLRVLLERHDLQIKSRIGGFVKERLHLVNGMKSEIFPTQHEYWNLLILYVNIDLERIDNSMHISIQNST
jgi:hypothetical protein